MRPSERRHVLGEERRNSSRALERNEKTEKIRMRGFVTVAWIISSAPVSGSFRGIAGASSSSAGCFPDPRGPAYLNLGGLGDSPIPESPSATLAAAGIVRPIVRVNVEPTRTCSTWHPEFPSNYLSALSPLHGRLGSTFDEFAGIRATVRKGGDSLAVTRTAPFAGKLARQCGNTRGTST